MGASQNPGGRAPRDVDAAGVSSQKTGARDRLPSPPFLAWQRPGEPRCLDVAGGSNQNSGGRAPLDVEAAGVSSQKTGACDCPPSPSLETGRTGRVLGESAARPPGHLSALDSGGGGGVPPPGSDDDVH